MPPGPWPNACLHPRAPWRGASHPEKRPAATVARPLARFHAPVRPVTLGDGRWRRAGQRPWEGGGPAGTAEPPPGMPGALAPTRQPGWCPGCGSLSEQRLLRACQGFRPEQDPGRGVHGQGLRDRSRVARVSEGLDLAGSALLKTPEVSCGRDPLARPLKPPRRPSRTAPSRILPGTAGRQSPGLEWSVRVGRQAQQQLVTAVHACGAPAPTSTTSHHLGCARTAPSQHPPLLLCSPAHAPGLTLSGWSSLTPRRPL